MLDSPLRVFCEGIGIPTAEFGVFLGESRLVLMSACTLTIDAFVGKSFETSLLLSTKGAAVKRLVASVVGVAVDAQALCVGEREILDFETLEEAGVKNAAKVATCPASHAAIVWCCRSCCVAAHGESAPRCDAPRLPVCAAHAAVWRVAPAGARRSRRDVAARAGKPENSLFMCVLRAHCRSPCAVHTALWPHCSRAAGEEGHRCRVVAVVRHELGQRGQGRRKGAKVFCALPCISTRIVI